MDSKRELIRRALSDFLPDYEKGLSLAQREVLKLDNLPDHPFGLSRVCTTDPDWLSKSVLWSNKATDHSCAVMALYLGSVLYNPNIHFGLRIIKVPIKGGRHNWISGGICHDYFFELGTKRLILIVGACTDYSGTGGNGMLKLTQMFQGFSELYGKPVQEITLSLREGEQRRAAIEAHLSQALI